MKEAQGSDNAGSERLDILRERKRAANQRVGEQVRQLSLAGFAAIWVLREVIPGHGSLIQPRLAVAAAFLVSALFVDLVHNLYTGWNTYHARQALLGHARGFRFEARFAELLNDIHLGNYFYLAKVVLMCVAYSLVFMECLRLVTL